MEKSDNRGINKSLKYNLEVITKYSSFNKPYPSEQLYGVHEIQLYNKTAL